MIILPEQEQGDGNETWSLEANWLKVYLLDDLVFCEDNSNVIAFVFCVLTEHKKPTWSTWRKVSAEMRTLSPRFWINYGHISRSIMRAYVEECVSRRKEAFTYDRVRLLVRQQFPQNFSIQICTYVQ